MSGITLVSSDILSPCFGYLANDPPDPNYGQVFVPENIITTPLSPPSAIPVDVATLMLQTVSDLDQTLTDLNAVQVTGNQYGSALAANDSSSAAMQYLAFLQYVGTCNINAGTTSADLAKLAGLLQTNSIGTQTPTATDLDNIANILQTQGTSVPGVSTYLESMGFTDSDIQLMLQQALANPPALPAESVDQALGDLANLFKSSSVLPPAQLAFGQQPMTTAPAPPSPPAIVVNVEDANGNIITSDNSNVTLSVANGDGSLNGTLTVQAQNGVATFSGLSVNAAGIYTIGAGDGVLATASTAFTISRATPTVTLSSPPPSITFDGTSDVTNWAIASVSGVSGVPNPTGLPNVVFYAGISPTGTPLASAPVIPGTYTVIAGYAGDANYGAGQSTPVTFVIINPALQVSTFTATNTGFTAVFNRPLNLGTSAVPVLNLYDNTTGTLGPADITLVGTVTGHIRGSLVVDQNNTRITFVETGQSGVLGSAAPGTLFGVLPNDTYTVTLRSASDGFQDADGNLLDGNADGTPGDNFVTTFVVNNPANSVIVTLPDFARRALVKFRLSPRHQRPAARLYNGINFTGSTTSGNRRCSSNHNRPRQVRYRSGLVQRTITATGNQITLFITPRDLRDALWRRGLEATRPELCP